MAKSFFRTIDGFESIGDDFKEFISDYHLKTDFNYSMITPFGLLFLSETSHEELNKSYQTWKSSEITNIPFWNKFVSDDDYKHNQKIYRYKAIKNVDNVSVDEVISIVSYHVNEAPRPTSWKKSEYPKNIEVKKTWSMFASDDNKIGPHKNSILLILPTYELEIL